MFGNASIVQMDADLFIQLRAEKKAKKAAALEPKTASRNASLDTTLDIMLSGNWSLLSMVCSQRQGTTITEEDQTALCMACKLGNYKAVEDLLYMGVDPCWLDNSPIRLARYSGNQEIISLLGQQPGVLPIDILPDDIHWADTLLLIAD